MSRPAAALAALTSLLLLVHVTIAGTASAQDAPAAPAAAAAARPGLGPALIVKAFVAGHPRHVAIAGGRVRVTDADGDVLGRGLTGHRGTAHVPLSSRPARIRVTVRGGHAGGRRVRGVWSAEVRGRARLVHVNPITTLIAHHRAARPRTSLRTATRRVKRYLGLPAGYDVATGPLGHGAFDGRKLLRHVRRDGMGVLSRQAHAIAQRPGARTERYRGHAPLHHATNVLDAPGPTRTATRRHRPSRRGRASAATLAAASTATTPAPPLARAAASADSWVRATQTVTSSTSGIIEGLGKLSKSLTWLGPWGGAVGVAAGVLSIAGLFTAEEDTTGEAIASISSDLQRMQSSINVLQTTVTQIRGDLQSVEQAALSAGQTGVVASTYQQAAAIKTNLAYLNAAMDLQLQIGCGDWTASDALDDPATCEDPVPLQRACPADTLLSYDRRRGRVLFPAGFPDTQRELLARTALERACVGWSDAMYGIGGFVAQVSGNAAMGGSPQTAIGWASMGTLANAITGTGATPGIVQYTSMLAQASSPFYDNASSNTVQAVAAYYQVLYAQLGTILPIYAAAIGESKANIATGLRSQPTLAQISARIPLPLPAGTVIDLRTGTMWSTRVGANLPCSSLIGWNQNVGAPCKGDTPAMRANAVMTNTPSTLTARAITPRAGSGLPAVAATSGNAPTLNLDAQAATPIDPRTHRIDGGQGRPFDDWYAAGRSHLQRLYAGSPKLQPNPPSGMTDGDWIKRSPHTSYPGAGLSPVLFGVNPTWNARAGNGIALPVKTIPNFPDAISGGYARDRLDVVVPEACSLAGNDRCAAPSYSPPVPHKSLNNPWWGAVSPWAFDLNNGTSNDGLGALIAAAGSVNWQTGVKACLGTHFQLFGPNTCANTQYYESISKLLDAGGFPTLFYRQPERGECYVYLPPGVRDTTSGNGTVCATGA